MRRELPEKLESSFSLEELRDLCHALAIKHENFTPRITPFARELVEYCGRQNRIEDLLTECQQRRPQLNWSDLGLPYSAAKENELSRTSVEQFTSAKGRPDKITRTSRLKWLLLLLGFLLSATWILLDRSSKLQPFAVLMFALAGFLQAGDSWKHSKTSFAIFGISSTFLLVWAAISWYQVYALFNLFCGLDEGGLYPNPGTIALNETSEVKFSAQMPPDGRMQFNWSADVGQMNPGESKAAESLFLRYY